MAIELDDLYERYGIQEDWRTKPRSLVLVVEGPNADAAPVLESFGVSSYEASVTWPGKGEMPLLHEVACLRPRFVFQVGGCWTPRLPVLDGLPGDKTVAEVTAGLPDRFVNLHHHDEYSLRDGLGTVHDLNRLLLAQGRSYCCVTNHGSLGGWVKQYGSCRDSGTKPLFGMEAYSNEYRDPDERKDHPESARKAFHLLLIARNQEGFDNLIRIHNDAQLNGFYYSPRVNHEACRRWGAGIVASTACVAGEVPQLLIEDRWDEAAALCDFFRGCFDEFYIELQVIEFAPQVELNRRLIRLAGRLDIPLIVACDSHYLVPEHEETHNVLMALRQGKKLDAAAGGKDEVWQFTTHNLYCRNAEEIEQLWRDGFLVDCDVDGNRLAEPYQAHYQDEVFTWDVLQEAMRNTRRIAIGCEDIDLDSEVKLPRMYEDSKDALARKAWQGLAWRGLDGEEGYRERLEFELKIIDDLGWNDYFLLVEKIVGDARDEYGDWVVGYGRGCFHPDDEVRTPSGDVPISQMRRGDPVYAHDGSLQRVEEAFRYHAEEQLVEVTTEDGRVMRPTVDHLVFVRRDGGVVEVPAGDLRPGDDILDEQSWERETD